jgi:hypothetical protein
MDWFWNPVRASGLHELLYAWYKSVTHANITTLCDRWHSETSSFHLPVGEMTITLDDVANLLHVPIEGLLDYEKKVSQEHGVNLMVRWWGGCCSEGVQEGVRRIYYLYYIAGAL